MKIFISGPMANKEDNNITAFNKMENDLRELGFDVYNPAWNFYGSDWDRKEMLAVDIMALSHCDGMVQLDGWRYASGCISEFAFANACDIPLYSEKHIREMLSQKTSISKKRATSIGYRFLRRIKDVDRTDARNDI